MGSEMCIRDRPSSMKGWGPAGKDGRNIMLSSIHRWHKNVTSLQTFEDISSMILQETPHYCLQSGPNIIRCGAGAGHGYNAAFPITTLSQNGGREDCGGGGASSSCRSSLSLSTLRARIWKAGMDQQGFAIREYRRARRHRRAAKAASRLIKTAKMQ